MSIGRIAHEAALTAFAESFRGGTERVDRLAGAHAPPPAALMALRVKQYTYRDRLHYLVPLGPLVLERLQLDVQLTLELRLLGADGTIL